MTPELISSPFRRSPCGCATPAELISPSAGEDPAPIPVSNERVAAIVATLRQVAGWGDVPPEDLVDLADVVEQQDWAAGGDDLGGLCCPMCQEVACDAGCPLEPERRREPCVVVADGH